MKRVILMGCVSLFTVNCAAINAAKGGNMSGALAEAKAAAEKQAAAFKEAVDKTKVDCKPLHDRVGDVEVPDGTDGDAKKALLDKAAADAKAKGYGVGWPEERAIGGAIAIGFAKGGKGLFIDITDKDVKALKAKSDKSKVSVKLSPGAKNDLDAYVALVGEHVVAGSARPGISWTFGVIENDSPNAFSTPGGYVLVTTGLLQLMENEAQLAGVLGHEIGHVTGRHSIHSYAQAKSTSCTLAVGGLHMVEAGLSEFPPAQEFVKNAKFGKTLLAFAKTEPVDMDNDKEIDPAFMQWFTNRIIDFQNLTGNAAEDEYDADRVAFELMATAGYDTKEFDKLIAKLPGSYSLLQHHPGNDKRIEALGKLRADGFGADGGKAPAFPSNLAWPKPQS